MSIVPLSKWSYLHEIDLKYFSVWSSCLPQLMKLSRDVLLINPIVTQFVNFWLSMEKHPDSFKSEFTRANWSWLNFIWKPCIYHKKSTKKVNFKIYIFNKKAFRSNANRPLADSPGDVVNKFEHVQRVGCCTVRSMLNKFDHFWGAGPGVNPCMVRVSYGHMGPPWEQKETNENITFPQLRWLTVNRILTNNITYFG